MHGNTINEGVDEETLVLEVGVAVGVAMGQVNTSYCIIYCIL